MPLSLASLGDVPLVSALGVLLELGLVAYVVTCAVEVRGVQTRTMVAPLSDALQLPASIDTPLLLERSLRTTERALSELHREARRQNLPLMVAVAPPAFAVHSERAGPTLSLVGLDPAGADLQAPDRAVVATLSRLGIASCDLGPDLRTAAESEAVYLTFDGHWSAAGHRVVADTLEACLRSRQWI